MRSGWGEITVRVWGCGGVYGDASGKVFAAAGGKESEIIDERERERERER
jgi:hypothetical protein